MEEFSLDVWWKNFHCGMLYWWGLSLGMLFRIFMGVWQIEGLALDAWGFTRMQEATKYLSFWQHRFTGSKLQEGGWWSSIYNGPWKVYSSTDSEVPCGSSFTSGSRGHSLTMGSRGHSFRVGSCGHSLTMGSCGHSFRMGSAVAIHQLMYGLLSWPGVGNKLPTVATLLPSPIRWCDDPAD